MINLFNSLPFDSELPSRFTNPFNYTPSEVVRVAAAKLMQYIDQREEWHAELSRGKMFGVLVVQSPDGELGYLSAFSGNLDGRTLHDSFVPPILDLHAPSYFFKEREGQISAINDEITRIKGCKELSLLLEELERNDARGRVEISDYKAFMKSRKIERDRLRGSSQIESIAGQLTAESQFQKAELKRLDAKFKGEISLLKGRIAIYTDQIEMLKSRRQQLSRKLQKDLFDSYMVLNHRGESKSMTQIFKDHRDAPPPSGAGECAAPKLLHHAFNNGFKPISMGEFWWGQSPNGEVRHHGEFYPACKSKCEPILGYMLCGMNLETANLDYSIKRDLRVIHYDNWLAVVDKPAGMLSVKGHVNIPSVESTLSKLFPQHPNAKVVHRLDMDTSGLLLIAFDPQTFSDLQRQFSQRDVFKEYLAIVDGRIDNEVGEVNLPLISDYEQRPRQKVDYTSGKEARSSYKVISRNGDQTRLLLSPHTGRTHQLRVHCAHMDGLAAPIVGDRLYGHPSTRLMLQAIKISFTHPSTLKRLTFTVAPEF